MEKVRPWCGQPSDWGRIKNTCIWRPRWRWQDRNFTKIFGIRELYRVLAWCCLITSLWRTDGRKDSQANTWPQHITHYRSVAQVKTNSQSPWSACARLRERRNQWAFHRLTRACHPSSGRWSSSSPHMLWAQCDRCLCWWIGKASTPV